MPRIFIGTTSSPGLRFHQSRVSARLCLYRDTMHMYHDTVKRGFENFCHSRRAGYAKPADAGRRERSVDEEEKAGGLGIQVIARAASVLRALEGRPEGLSLGQIAKEVGLARSTVQRIVAALASEDFVTEAQPGHGVRIGPGLARIAASLSAN